MYLLILTVLKQHVDCVKRCPANGEQQNDGDHHFNSSFLFPEGKNKNNNVDLYMLTYYSWNWTGAYIYLYIYSSPFYTQFAKASSLCCSSNSHCLPRVSEDMLCCCRGSLKHTFYDSNAASCFQQETIGFMILHLVSSHTVHLPWSQPSTTGLENSCQKSICVCF